MAPPEFTLATSIDAAVDTVDTVNVPSYTDTEATLNVADPPAIVKVLPTV